MPVKHALIQRSGDSGACLQASDSETSVMKWDLTKQEELDQLRALMRERGKACNDEWLVAWDDGPLHLHLTDGALRATFVSLSEDLEILSYSWGSDKINAGNSTEGYGISRRLLKITFAKPTWVDAISHLGDEELVRRTLHRMGSIYHKYPVRPEWLEYRQALPAVEAMSRMWMWQEQALSKVVVPQQAEDWQRGLLAIIRGQVRSDSSGGIIGGKFGRNMIHFSRFVRGNNVVEEALAEAADYDKVGGDDSWKMELASLAQHLDCSQPTLLVDGKFHPNIADSLLRAYNTRRLTFQNDLVIALLGVICAATRRTVELTTSLSQDYSTWSVRELKSALERCKIDVRHVLEKSELMSLTAENASFYDKNGVERGADVRAVMQELILALITTGKSDLKVPLRNIPGFDNLHGLRNVSEASVRMLADPDDEAVVTLANGTEIQLVIGEGGNSLSTVMRCVKSADATLWIFETYICLGVRKEDGDGDLDFTHSVFIESKFDPMYARIVEACGAPRRRD